MLKALSAHPSARASSSSSSVHTKTSTSSESGTRSFLRFNLESRVRNNQHSVGSEQTNLNCPNAINLGATKFKKNQSVQSLSHVCLFATPWTEAHQASLSITNSWSLLKLMSIESVMPSNHLILCRPLLLLPSIFPNIRVFSNKSVFHIRWAKYWSLSFSISPSNEC